MHRDVAGEVAKIWLIKSSGNIRGPYSLEEVIQLLTTKHISLIDEIRSPESRWTFIREHKLLSHVVQFVRDQEIKAKEDTGNTHVLSHTVTHTVTSTGVRSTGPKQVVSSSDLQSQALPNYLSNSPQADPASEASANQAPLKHVKSISTGQTIEGPAFKTVSQRKFPLMPAIGGAILCVIGAFVYINYKSQAPPPILPIKKVEPQKTVSPEVLLANFEKSFTSADFDKAYQDLLVLEKVQSLRPKEIIKKLQIMVVQMGQSTAAQQIIDGLDLSIFDEESKLEIQNLKGIIKINDSQYMEARTLFEDLENLDSTYEPAQINVMTTLLIEGKYNQVNDEFRKMMLAGVKDPTIFILRAVAAYFGNSERAKFESVAEDLSKFVVRYQDLQNEALFLLAAIYTKIGKLSEATQAVFKMAKNDPDLTRKHFSGFSVSRAGTGWKYFAPICDGTVRALQGSSAQKVLEGYCKFQTEDLVGALSIFERARSQYPNDSPFAGLQAFVLYKLRRSSELDAFIQSSSNINDELFHLVAGWNCLDKGDMNCSEREFKIALAVNPNNIAALVGLAKKELQAKNQIQMQTFLNQAKSVSDSYRPLIQMKAQTNVQ